MLFSKWTEANSNSCQPTLVFLHGLLGNSRDWSAVTELLPHFNTLTIDLPGHGQSRNILCDGFDHCCQLVSKTIRQACTPEHALYLIGYSLGGRIVMYGAALNCFADLNVQGIVIEGGNFGLTDQNQKDQRLASDSVWADRFKNESIEHVLTDWYQQPLFSSLNYEQKQTLIEQRSDNLGASIASMLGATSLAKQPYLLPLLQHLPQRCHYIYGSRDTKFAQLALYSHLSTSVIQDAGHNAHNEKPVEFARTITQWAMA
jgi:2-succinyl-6-hydroxy-2,4-cyclohexadiene-1-carboxylate synthase